MSSKRKTPKAGRPPASPATATTGDASFERRMALAEEIMREDREVLRVLADVTTRRRRALAKLAK